MGGVDFTGIYLRSNTIRIRWVYSPPDGRAGQGICGCLQSREMWSRDVDFFFLFYFIIMCYIIN